MAYAQARATAAAPALGVIAVRSKRCAAPQQRTCCCAVKAPKKAPTWLIKTYKSDGSHVRKGACQHVEVEADGSDSWRLDPVAEIIRNGGIGVIPTDSYPALVCDLETAASVNMLAAVKDVSPSKPMSILVKGFADIDKYTLGWPAAKGPGEPDTFSIVKKLLPGPFTFILPASKNMPKIQPQGSSKAQRKKKQRLTVGVRMPDSTVCRELLELLDTPLLCTSVHVSDDGVDDFDAASLMDNYPDIDFVVDDGFMPKGGSGPSTIVDMAGEEIEVVRRGKGDSEPFED